MSDDIRLKITQEGAAQTQAALQGVKGATEQVRTATTASASATDAAAGAAGRAEKSQGDLARATKAAGDGAQDMARKAAGGAQVLEGIKMAASGGAGALFGLGKAWSGLMEIVGLTGPWGKALQLIGAVGSAALVLKSSLDSSKESAEAAKKEWDAAISVLGNRRTDKFAADLERIKELAAGATEEIERLARARDRMDNAEMGAQLDEVAADESLTPEQRKVRELEIRGEFAQRAEQRRMDLVDEPVTVARGNLARVTSQRQNYESRAEQIRVQLAADATAEQEAERELAEADQMFASGPLTRTEHRQATAQRNRATAQLQSLRDPGVVARRDVMRRQMDDFSQAGASLRGEEQDAAQDLALAEERAATEREVLAAEAAAAARGRRASMAAAQRAVQRATSTDGTVVGAVDQARADRVAELGGNLSTRATAAAERGALGANGESIADAARAVEQATGALKGEATAGELSGAVQVVAKAMEQLGQAQQAEAKAILADFRKMKTEIDAQLARVNARIATSRGTP